MEATKISAAIKRLRTLNKAILKKGCFEAFIFRMEDAPIIVEEIGRLREVTFRQVGEGTGKCRDNDGFDTTYLHLVLWDEMAQALVGAYRIGLVDDLLEISGPTGLYTSTLFDWNESFLRRHRQSLELGRSFVVPDYQKNFWALHLLWKALGKFLSENPFYRYLFGPVSISGALPLKVQTQLVECLKHHHGDYVLTFPGPVAKAKKEFVTSGATYCFGVNEPLTLLDVQKYIQNSSNPTFKVPPLLKHYVALGGELLSVNIDESFQNSVDCLFILDLFRSNQFLLSRYVEKVALSRLAQNLNRNS